MAVIVGIDTGGTYTDAILLDAETGCVIKTAKAFTTPKQLSVGILNCLKEILSHNEEKIEKVMLSTTLATNAIVEGNGQSVGLICLGKQPAGRLPTPFVAVAQGFVNAKGRETSPVDREEIMEILARFEGQVKALAVSGLMSVRNPAQENRVREIILDCSSLPVVCGCDLVNELGFYERTVTAVLNARLMPIMADFMTAIKDALREMSISAEVYILRGDGSIVRADAMLLRPVETILSGPAASIVGAGYLTDAENAIIVDIGGTTADTALLQNGNVVMSRQGACVGGWKTQIRSLEIRTTGLGGDSKIRFTSDRKMEIGPCRTEPACRGGDQLTPTDLLHRFPEFRYGDKEAAVKMIKDEAVAFGTDMERFCDFAEGEVLEKMRIECIEPWERKYVPLIGIGAPAEAWIGRYGKRYDTEVIIPSCFEVANAVGAAVAKVTESATGIIRRGEEGHGYLVHLRTQRKAFADWEKAIEYAEVKLKEDVRQRMELHGAAEWEFRVEKEEIYTDDGTGGKAYVETKVRVKASETERFAEAKSDHKKGGLSGGAK